jgi:hypothetical protein
MPRKNPPNFDVLAKHILALSDAWKEPERIAAEPAGRLQAITTVITTCFGPDGAEAIARDLITEFDDFDDALLEASINESVDPGPTERQDQLAKMLRREFSD